MAEKYCWSDCEDEEFMGEHETREDALEEGRDAREAGTTIWTGIVSQPKRPAVKIGDVYDFVEQKQDEAYDLGGEATNGWLDVDKEKLEGLRVGFDEVFRAWLVKHELEPQWSVVDAIREHPPKEQS